MKLLLRIKDQQNNNLRIEDVQTIGKKEIAKDILTRVIYLNYLIINYCLTLSINIVIRAIEKTLNYNKCLNCKHLEYYDYIPMCKILSQRGMKTVSRDFGCHLWKDKNEI